MANSFVTNLYPKPTPGATDQVSDVRVTYDDSAPTSTNGHILFAGRSYTWSKQAATAAKFIEDSTVTATIHASEFTD